MQPLEARNHINPPTPPVKPLKTNLQRSVRAPTLDDVGPFDWTLILRQRIAMNKNNLIVITGETGSGKSLAALDLARKLDLKFTSDEIVFRVSDFLGKVQTLEKGRVLIFDEAAVDFDARRSMSKQNINLSNILKIFRYLNLNVVFTLPNLEMLDVNARRLMSHHVVMAGIDRARKMSYAHLFGVDSHKSLDGAAKRYFYNINIEPQGLSFKLDPIAFELPPLDLRKGYEEKKNAYVRSLFDEMGREWSATEDQAPRPAAVGSGIPAEPFRSLPPNENATQAAHGDHIGY